MKIFILFLLFFVVVNAQFFTFQNVYNTPDCTGKVVVSYSELNDEDCADEFGQLTNTDVRCFQYENDNGDPYSIQTLCAATSDTWPVSELKKKKKKKKNELLIFFC